MRGISKSFPGVRALNDVSLTVRAGTVHALMGENGAGKSTLMKCLFGIYSKDSGEVFLDGKRADFKSPREALAGGVAMVHQELSQALSRTAADNIYLGRYPASFGFVREGETRRLAAELFRSLGISADPARLMSSYSVGVRQMVEIAKAVSYDARVIVFDEPTSSLTENEAEELFRIIESLKRRGCGIIYISHKMDEIMRISDDISVMRDGCLVESSRAADFTVERIISLMVGRELVDRFPDAHITSGDVLLRVCALTAEHSRLRDVSFSARRGEIIGLAGLGGSGRTELLECIFGIAARRSGTVVLDGELLPPSSPPNSVRRGAALITEERRRDGIFANLDITANTVIACLRACRRGAFLSRRVMNRLTDETIRSMRVKAPSRKTKIRTLSGGNQQKIILGRWLLTEPKLFLMDEPTRGIDVGAKAEIYSLIVSLAQRGRCVIVASSELAELLGLCSRILVMHDGTLAGELSREEATQEKIMALASGLVPDSKEDEA